MGKRGSYFYVIDAFVASTILILTIILIGSYSATETSVEKDVFLIEDVFIYLQGTEVRDADSPVIRYLLDNGLINRTEDPILTMMGKLYAKNESGCVECGRALRNYSKEMVEQNIPGWLGASLSINATIMYARSPQTLASANKHFASTRLIFYRINTTDMYGPIPTTIEVWQ